MAQYALYIAILADFFATIPTISRVWRKPETDRPFPWALFAIGYGLGAFAVPEHTFANYVLPAYMLIAGLLITAPLLLHRLKNSTLKEEWV